MNAAKLTRLIANLADACGKELTEGQLSAWVAYLIHLPEEEVETVALRWPLKEKWFPSISEFMEQIRQELPTLVAEDEYWYRIALDHGSSREELSEGIAPSRLKTEHQERALRAARIIRARETTWDVDQVRKNFAAIQKNHLTEGSRGDKLNT